MKRTPLKRRQKRGDPLAAQYAARWYHAVASRGCQVCPELGEECEPGPIQAHHIVYQQHIERLVSAVAHEQYLDEKAELELLRKLLWDARNGMGACYRAHRRHHNRVQPIPLRLVPMSAIVFAAEIGLAHRIDEAYPADG